MAVERTEIGDCTLICGKAEEVLPTLESGSVHLILCDPPYFQVKTSYLGAPITWDRQWASRDAYLAWLRGLAKEWQRILAPNGSLYCFASPQMAAHVEVMLEESFHVLNQIIWRKHDGSGADTGGHSKVCKEALRCFFPQTEHILFCEQYASDALALGESGYAHAEQSLKTSLFSAPIAEAMAATGATAREVTEAIGAYGTVNHGGAVSNWLRGYNIPTKAQYEAMRTYLNSRAGQEYGYLQREHDDLRREYGYLRQEYEDLRRPFTLSASVPYTDVWEFATVPYAPGKHACEKPLPMLRHIINVSSRKGDTVLDCCAGSFSTLEAARQCGRRSIGIDDDPVWYQRGQRRLSQLLLFQAAL